jgi:ParB family chromosome partitioning protein
MAKRKAPVRRKKVAASSVGLTAAETAHVDDRELESLSSAIAKDDGVVLARFRDPVGGLPLILACLPVDRVEPTPYQRDASDTHVKRLMGVVRR